MFDREYSFKGKYARYVKDLVDEANLFNRNLDVYILAPIVGFLYGRMKNSEQESAGELTTKIFTEQLLKEQTILKYIYRLIVLLDESELSIDSENRIDRAFRMDGDNEAVQKNMRIFDSYVLGGVEYLHEKLFVNKINRDEYIDGLFEFVEEFKQDLAFRLDTDDISNIISQFD